MLILSGLSKLALSETLAGTYSLAYAFDKLIKADPGPGRPGPFGYRHCPDARPLGSDRPAKRKHTFSGEDLPNRKPSVPRTGTATYSPSAH